MKIRVEYNNAVTVVRNAMLKTGLSHDDADVCALTHVESSAHGVESHGLNRVPLFLDYVKRGLVDPKAQISLLKSKGAVERYDGKLGIGITNALYCTKRAIALAKDHGIGCVTLKNTTHWMRGGTYTRKMAEAGFVGMNWINTESCMPLWGSDVASVGNNPFCLGIPHKEYPIVIDMAMSQFAYGKLGVYKLANEQLPIDGGFTKDGVLTRDPGAIMESMRLLPTGYWKGSSMALVLDLAAAMMSGGKTGSDMDREQNAYCTSCSQVFIAYDPYMFGDEDELNFKVEDRIAAAKNAHLADENSKIIIPGARASANMERSIREGVSVDDAIWSKICELSL